MKKRIFAIGHSSHGIYDPDIEYETVACYMSEDDAKAHLEMIFDKLVEYQKAGKCCGVNRVDNYNVECKLLCRTDDILELIYDLEEWYYFPITLTDTLPDKIEL